MGGMETHLETLCAGLKEICDLRVVVAGDEPETRRETLAGVDVERLGTKLTLASSPITPGLARRIRGGGADLVHVHLPHPTAILSYLASRRSGALVATYHSDIVRQRLLGRLFAPFQDAFLRRCGAILATSPDYLASSPVLATHRDRCRVVPYGIPLAQFTSADPEDVARIRERHGPRILLAVGRLIYYKGFDVLIDAMRDIDAALLLIGDGPLRKELEERASTNGVGQRVRFLGEIQNRDVTPFFHACDVFVLPSVARSEAFGIVQIEALAAGRPVVNTALDSGVPFVSRHGETGLTVPPRDSAALAGAANRLLSDPGLRASLGEAGRRRAHDDFSAERMIERTLEIYREVMTWPRANALAAAAAGS